ncbi:MAG: hypothetical protein R3308_03285 [Thiohalobacterales bacterium]|nr:hypothetical protein [Thiohalobacterales bacterium]
MTRIIAITGSNPGVGKTQIAVNISLELVRRGRQVALFHLPDEEGASIERIIDIQPLVERRKHAADGHGDEHIISRGYIGIDILSCEVPLREWVQTADDTLTHCVHAMEVEDGYEDFLVDTSGMGPREQVSCCLASPLVILVITPEAQSQAEAFALLRVLQLNGFSGDVRVLVNRAHSAVDATDIHQSFSREVRSHLGVGIGPPLILPEDAGVSRAERYRQAFSAVFPDSEAAAGIVVIADALEGMPGDPSAGALFDYWGRFIETIRSPIRLPGKVLLDTATDTVSDTVEDVSGVRGERPAGSVPAGH